MIKKQKTVVFYFRKKKRKSFHFILLLFRLIFCFSVTLANFPAVTKALRNFRGLAFPGNMNSCTRANITDNRNKFSVSATLRIILYLCRTVPFSSAFCFVPGSF